MEIAERDQKIIRIRAAMKAIQNNILPKMLQLEEMKKDNPLLEPIYLNYKNMHDQIVDQKRKQQAQMELLSAYLEKTMTEEELTDSTFEHARRQQIHILTELDKVQEELDALEIQ